MAPDAPSSHLYTASWERCMPDTCTARFWTDSSLQELVETFYPGLAAVYNSSPVPVLKWDMARYLILHRHGGIYRDSDYECTAPRGSFSLLQPDMYVHVVESRWRFNERVQNSLMASVPGHPLWIDLAYDIAHVASKGWCRNREGLVDVLASTGPQRLERWVASPEYVACVNVLPWQTYFEGDQAWHHGNVSWVNSVYNSSSLKKECGCSDESCKVRGFVCKD
mmetsp:Transcript_28893/g.81360  ORF Transcript_28893/g.81360 Transcript_28893/m.81360 type:complete len:223 (+) Transcript_28893:267-935(+)